MRIVIIAGSWRQDKPVINSDFPVALETDHTPWGTRAESRTGCPFNVCLPAFLAGQKRILQLEPQRRLKPDLLPARRRCCAPRGGRGRCCVPLYFQRIHPGRGRCRLPRTFPGTRGMRGRRGRDRALHPFRTQPGRSRCSGICEFPRTRGVRGRRRARVLSIGVCRQQSDTKEQGDGEDNGSFHRLSE